MPDIYNAPPKYNGKTWPIRPRRVRPKKAPPSIRFRVAPNRITAFGHFLQDNRVTYERAATELGCSMQYVQMLATGGSVPKLATAARIEKWTRRIDPDGCVIMQAWIELIPARELVLGRADRI